MNKQMKFVLAKYLLAAAPFMLIANTANAQTRRALTRNANTYGNDSYDLSLHIGFIGALPETNENMVCGKKAMTGFNGGGFVELGGAKWYKLGRTDFEFHLEPFARFETVSLNTCAYATHAAYNKANANGEYTLSGDYPYERVQDFVTTANLNLGLGYNGFTLEVLGGLGIHADTKKQHGLIMAIGGGLGARITDNLKLRLGYRANANIFSNFGSKENPTSAPMFRHDVEVGMVYVFNKKQNTHNNYYTHNYYHGHRR